MTDSHKEQTRIRRREGLPLKAPTRVKAGVTADLCAPPDRLGIELGAGVIPRSGLMSVAVPLCFDEGMVVALCQRSAECGAIEVADEEFGFDLALGVLSVISRKH